MMIEQSDANQQDLASLTCWLGLTQTQGLGNQSLVLLLKAFGTPQQVYATNHTALKQVVSIEIASRILAGPDEARILPSLEWLAIAGNHLITLADEHYPKLLLEIANPPPILFAKGHLHLLGKPCIAMVGSRSSTPQGEKNAEDFAKALSEQGFTVVSGMALGIDGAAHRGALKAQSIKGAGSTIAVVGTGLDIVYPSKHRDLAHAIVNQGLMISEFIIGTPSKPQNFPRRNRIISGLSLGCLVVEANVQSGSLITARLATEQGREVFAIPGSIHSPVAKGCHLLIKQGAKLVDSTHDIIEELGFALENMRVEHSAAGETAAQTDTQAATAAEVLRVITKESALLTAMGYDAVSLDALATLTGLSTEMIMSELLLLELDGKITKIAGGKYQRLG